MLLNALVLLGVVALPAATAKPVRAVALSSLPAPFEQPVSSADTKWACDVRAWVRAPDLQPNMVATGDARLLLNGSACGDVNAWAVGLRLKERAIVRLPAEGVELPVEPTFNKSANVAFYQAHRIDYEDIFNIGWVRSEEQRSPYNLAREAYDLALRNKSLWEVHGVERKVLDVQAQLAAGQGADAIPLEAVKSFGIAVPNVNLPPAGRDGDSRWTSGEKGFVNSEALFDWYFALTLRNETVFEVPAGQVAFIPFSPPLPAVVTKENVTVSLERPPTGSWMWSVGSIANCTADNTTAFTVEIEVPSGEHAFESGKELWLPITIRRINGTAQGPTYLTLNPSTVASETWSSAFGHTPEERQSIALPEEARGGGRFRFDNGVKEMRMARPVPTLKEQQAAAQKEDEEGMVTRRRCWSDGPGVQHPGGAKLDPTLEEQTVLVNFTIPARTMPTFKTTFKDYLSHIQVTLTTTQACSTEPSAPTVEELDDLNDDDLWTEYRSRSQSRAALKKSLTLTHLGNLSIVINSPLAAPADVALPVHYTDPSALRPLLFPAAEAPPPSVARLDSVIEEERGEQLKRSRYRWDAPWSSGRYVKDGRYQLAGQVWAKKVQREKDLSEAKKEREKVAFVAQV